jgi:ferredoxin-NADP reductase
LETPRRKKQGERLRDAIDMAQDGTAREHANRLALRVVAVAREAEDIISIELAQPDGQPLPPFTAGAHIDIHLADGLIRQYSLCNPPAERNRYVIAVLKEVAGRGGSEAMHRLKTGETVITSAPRNNFPLAGREADFHLMLAGGIGVTPMMAMIAELKARKVDFRLHYCTRNKSRTAFLRRLRPLIRQDKVVLHHDDGDPACGLDIAATLAEPVPGQHLYVCGPAGFMSAAKAAAGAWPPHAVHFEHFNAVALSDEEAAWDKVPFEVKIKKTGETFDVPAGCSIVKVLREHGIEVETSCEDGYCGTCITRYVDGEPVHRDSVLSEGERRNYVMVCRARSRSAVLVLDV